MRFIWLHKSIVEIVFFSTQMIDNISFKSFEYILELLIQVFYELCLSKQNDLLWIKGWKPFDLDWIISFLQGTTNYVRSTFCRV